MRGGSTDNPGKRLLQLTGLVPSGPGRMSRCLPCEYNRVRQGWSRCSFRPRTSNSAPLTAGPLDGPEQQSTTSSGPIVGVCHGFIGFLRPQPGYYFTFISVLMTGSVWSKPEGRLSQHTQVCSTYLGRYLMPTEDPPRTSRQQNTTFYTLQHYHPVNMLCYNWDSAYLYTRSASFLTTLSK